jgi:hypothetical protein
MYTSYPKMTIQGCSLYICSPSFFSSPLSNSQIYTVADKQGGVRGESGTALTEQAATRLTLRFAASDADVLGERELQDRCTLHLSVFENTRDNPRVQKKSVPLHHASRHAWIDVSTYGSPIAMVSNLASISRELALGSDRE